ncbi:ComF family protein [Lachnoclostridium phytofermentans]|uniref:ComF family protein n=1 Tax=Lachnoclostridium phytofermentans TaxID=66219 RepID=UPI00069009DF|nr:ComF family protein [Lachnoclostridium phytofermentans]
MLKKIGKEILDAVYPKRCPICSEILVPKERKICSSCSEELPVLMEPRCKKCSKPVLVSEQEYCFDCVKKQHHYARGYACFLYNEKLKKSLSEFKYHVKKEYADFYVAAMVAYLGEWIHKTGAEVLIPVPLHKNKYKRRGFNQAQLLAEGLSKALSIPVDTKLLVRTIDTIPQKKLDNKERMRNLEMAFSILTNGKESEKLFPYKRVILVDDIYTTGSTIEACTNVLQRAGCPEVFFVTVCIGSGF